MDYLDLIKYIVTFLLGLGSGYLLNITITNKKRISKYKVSQKNNTVSGDQAGRDINKGKSN